jgi:hypothetical protein
MHSLLQEKNLSGFAKIVASPLILNKLRRLLSQLIFRRFQMRRRARRWDASSSAFPRPLLISEAQGSGVKE